MIHEVTTVLGIAVICYLIGLGVNMMIVLNREERKYLIGIIRRKLHI